MMSDEFRIWRTFLSDLIFEGACPEGWLDLLFDYQTQVNFWIDQDTDWKGVRDGERYPWDGFKVTELRTQGTSLVIFTENVPASRSFGHTLLLDEIEICSHDTCKECGEYRSGSGHICHQETK